MISGFVYYYKLILLFSNSRFTMKSMSPNTYTIVFLLL